MQDSFEHQIIRMARRRWVAVVAAIYLLPFVWLGLVPFDFARNVTQGHATWLGLAIAPAHWPDILANVVLYVPVGLLIRPLWRRRVSRRHGDLASAILLGMTVSYVTEWTQWWSPSRVSSVADFAANTVGVAIGAFGYSLLSILKSAVAVRAQLAGRRWKVDVIERPSLVAAKVVALVILLTAAAPFDLTFSVNRLVQSVESTHWRPLARHAQLSPTVYEQRSTSDPKAQERVMLRRQRDRFQLTLDYVRVGTCFALLGGLVTCYLRKHCAVTALMSIGWAIWSALVLGVACFAVQWLVMSRSSDVTEIIMGVVGAAFGAVAMQSPTLYAMVSGAPVVGIPARQRWSQWLGWSIAGLCVFAVMRELAPFVVRIPTGMDAMAASIEWLPFYQYQRTKLPIALHDMLGKVSIYASIGGLWAIRRIALSSRRHPARPMRVAAFAMIGMAILESAQLIIAERTPAVTDVLLAGIGAGAGVIVARVGIAYVALIRAQRNVHLERVIYNVEFGGDAPPENLPHSAPDSLSHPHE